MIRQPRRPPAALPQPDFGARHALAAVAWLFVSALTGIVLAFAPASEWTLRAALAYGVFGLVGFLSQMVIGVGARLLPMYSWYLALAGAGFEQPPVSAHEMPVRTLQRGTFVAWTLGVPCLAGGFFFNAVPFLAAGAWMLLAGVLLSAANTVVVLRHAFPRRQTARSQDLRASEMNPSASPR
jgi:hypothetical protein